MQNAAAFFDSIDDLIGIYAWTINQIASPVDPRNVFELREYFRANAASYLGWNTNRVHAARDLQRCGGMIARDWTRFAIPTTTALPSGSETLCADWARWWATYIQLPPTSPLTKSARQLVSNIRPYCSGAVESDLEDFAESELIGWGRIAARTKLANRTLRSDAIAPLCVACEVPHETSAQRSTEKRKPDAESALWTCLARVLSQTFAPEDADALSHMATHATSTTPLLAAGLRFIVRGDVLALSGEIIELDWFSQQLGLTPLPLVETGFYD